MMTDQGNLSHTRAPRGLTPEEVAFVEATFASWENGAGPLMPFTLDIWQAQDESDEPGWMSVYLKLRWSDRFDDGDRAFEIERDKTGQLSVNDWFFKRQSRVVAFTSIERAMAAILNALTQDEDLVTA